MDRFTKLANVEVSRRWLYFVIGLAIGIVADRVGLLDQLVSDRFLRPILILSLLGNVWAVVRLTQARQSLASLQQELANRDSAIELLNHELDRNERLIESWRRNPGMKAPPPKPPVLVPAEDAAAP